MVDFGWRISEVLGSFSEIRRSYIRNGFPKSEIVYPKWSSEIRNHTSEMAFRNPKSYIRNCLPMDWQITSFAHLDLQTLTDFEAKARGVCRGAILSLSGCRRDGQHGLSLIGWEGEALIAYLRILAPKTVYPDACSIGRVLVVREFRGKGFAKKS